MFEKDKILHITLSLFLMLFFGIFTTHTIAFLITLGLGILKEIYDYFHPAHSADIYDIYADVIGIMLGLMILTL